MAGEPLDSLRAAADITDLPRPDYSDHRPLRVETFDQVLADSVVNPPAVPAVRWSDWLRRAASSTTRAVVAPRSGLDEAERPGGA